MTIMEPRPYWQAGAEPCPSWCIAPHERHNFPEDRDCFGDPAQLPLSFLPGVYDSGNTHHPEGLCVQLVKGWREGGAHIDMGWINGSMDGFAVTLDEAERLMSILRSLIDRAKEAAK